MTQQFEAVQKFGKDSFDATVKALDVASTGTKAIVVETADYAKKSFDQNAATFEKLAGVKSLDQAIQIQSDYLKRNRRHPGAGRLAQERLRRLCRARDQDP